jgi:hypothetical protein
MKECLFYYIIIITSMMYITSQLSYIPYIHARQGIPNKYNYAIE